MARLEGVPERQASAEVRAIYERVVQKFGKMLEPISITANHPGILNAYMSYERWLAGSSRVELKLKELAFLKVAAIVGCPFCLDIGSALAKAAGLTEGQLQDLGNYSESSAFSIPEKLILELATAMTGNPVDVPNSLFSRLTEMFDSAQIVEIIASIAWENYRSRFFHALGVESQGFSSGNFCARREHA